MNLEDFQRSWQSQDTAHKVSLNANALLAEVQRKQQCFRRTIFLRDMREIGVAALLIPVFLWGGWKVHWTLYLNAFGCFVIGAFMLLDRRLQRRTTPIRHGALKDCVTTALADVSHQIWLLRNVMWWYLLPLYVPMVLFFGWSMLDAPGPIFMRLWALQIPIAFVTALYAGIYWLNQTAVKKSLEPRRKELEEIMNGLENGYQPPPMKTKKPLGPLLLVLAACATSVVLQAALNTKPTTLMPPLDKAFGVPAMAVVVTKDEQICDRAAAGVRKLGDPTTVTTNDIWHIGSCTKSMTATLTAMFIEQGTLRWDTTIAEVFPDLKGKMDARYEGVTVDQLLHHRGGVPHDSPSAAWRRAWKEIGSPTEQRREFIEAVLKAGPEAEPGTKMIYSNDGYVIVGAMLEKISGRDFESLMRDKLFKPLRMETAGFGFPGTKDKSDQPWGHVSRSGATMPTQADNPPVHSPSGRVHGSLDDLARYAMFHLQPGTNALLKPETMARLHASPAGADIRTFMDDYACGWVRMERGWAGGTVLWHNGSNTMWYIVMWLAPEKNFCVIAVTNMAGDEAEQACDAAATAMIQKWLN